MKKFKKLVLILLAVLFVVCAFSGCGEEEEKGFAWGFEKREEFSLFQQRRPYTNPHCAVSGESKTFDKEKVTFNLHYGKMPSYGGFASEGFYIAVYYSVTTDELYAGLSKNACKILKVSKDDFYSDEYNVTVEKERLKERYHFNHSEPVTIPPEAFDCGDHFSLCIMDYSPETEDLITPDGYVILSELNQLPMEFSCFNTCSIYFKIDGDKVIFTDYSPKEYK